jgi:Predicted transcriptional regulators
MNLTTISEISKELCISTRTLRYYEQIGLIRSVKKDDYAYRTYDTETVTRLQRILVLRKLRIPLKQIGVIMHSGSAAEIIDAFRQNLKDIDEELTALSTIREIINNFINRLNDDLKTDLIELNLLDDTSLLETMDSLTVPIKYPKFSMGFDIAHNDKEMTEVFDFYQKAFGANKIVEFSPPGSNKDNLHIVMEIYGIEVLLHPVGYGEEKIQPGGLWAYDNDDNLRRTIDILSRNAREITMNSSPHWPICAFITDKYGIMWTLHN